MDPFVVTSLGKKTYRTRVVKHNLNPVFDEKLVFQVLRHETNYSLNFTIVDRDKLSGNDFVGTANFALQTAVTAQPEADPQTGLYRVPDPPEAGPTPNPEYRRSRFKLSSSRSTSSTNIPRTSRNPSSTNLYRLGKTPSNTSLQQSRPNLRSEASGDSLNMDDMQSELSYVSKSTSNPQEKSFGNIQPTSEEADDPDLRYYTIPLTLKNKERWEDKHSPTIHVLAKYLPYQALRQQFWRAMLKHYDADDSGKLDKVELTTMLDTLGSTLHEATIKSFFTRFASDNGGNEFLTMDQAVICLEDRLQQNQAKTLGDTIRGHLPQNLTSNLTSRLTAVNNGGTDTPGSFNPSQLSSSNGTPLNNRSETSIVPALEISDLSGDGGQDGNVLPEDDLADEEKGEEHVIEIQECPICHQPRLDKKNSDADIITHVATCASQDWRAVNNIVMGGFVTSSQAQRKWYSKVITKIGYGGYKLGANSANTLIQDRITGQINEERMSVYVRLGIRLLYKGLKSSNMEKKRSKHKSQTSKDDTDILTLFSSQALAISFFQARAQV